MLTVYRLCCARAHADRKTFGQKSFSSLESGLKLNFWNCPRWKWHSSLFFLHLKNISGQCVGCHHLWFIQRHVVSPWQIGSKTVLLKNKTELVLACGHFSEHMPIHQSSSHTCWFVEEMTPGAINLALNKTIFFYLIVLLLPQLQISEVVQLVQIFRSWYFDLSSLSPHGTSWSGFFLLFCMQLYTSDF